MQKPKIIVVSGPTASGKTSLSIELAKQFNGEIISADSMQVYIGLNIGTAKPDEKEKQGIVHHLIDIRKIDEPYNVSGFITDAKKAASHIISKNKVPVICGGTGLYIEHFVNNTTFSDVGSDERFREELNQKTNEELYEELKNLDPSSAEKIHINNRKRVVRALEIYKLSSKTKSAYDEESKNCVPEYEFIEFGLNFAERGELYSRINNRVEIMIKKGLEEEVLELYENGESEKLRRINAIGYTEFLDYFDGRLNKEEAIEKIKQNTRNYAKRQITWFKRNNREYKINITKNEMINSGLIFDNCRKIIEKFL